MQMTLKHDAKTFLKHFSDCLFYFCFTCADSITQILLGGGILLLKWWIWVNSRRQRRPQWRGYVPRPHCHIPLYPRIWLLHRMINLLCTVYDMVAPSIDLLCTVALFAFILHVLFIIVNYCYVGEEGYVLIRFVCRRLCAVFSFYLMYFTIRNVWKLLERLDGVCWWPLLMVSETGGKQVIFAEYRNELVFRGN